MSLCFTPKVHCYDASSTSWKVYRLCSFITWQKVNFLACYAFLMVIAACQTATVIFMSFHTGKALKGKHLAHRSILPIFSRSQGAVLMNKPAVCKKKISRRSVITPQFTSTLTTIMQSVPHQKRPDLGNEALKLLKRTFNENLLSAVCASAWRIGAVL